MKFFIFLFSIFHCGRRGRRRLLPIGRDLTSSLLGEVNLAGVGLVRLDLASGWANEACPHRPWVMLDLAKSGEARALPKGCEGGLAQAARV